MNKWKLAEGSQVAGVNAGNVQQIGNELYRLAEVYKTLEPKVIVAAARVPKSPLNPIIYRLNDKAAAAEHRLWLARTLIKSVRVLTEEGEETLEQRVFVNVINGNQRGYMLIPTVMGDAVLREQVLEKAKLDLQAWRERYQDLQELAAIFSVIDEVVASPVKKRIGVETSRGRRPRSQPPSPNQP